MVKFDDMSKSKESIVLKVIHFFLLPYINGFIKRISNDSQIAKIINLYSEDKFIPIRFWDAPFMEVEQLVSKKGLIIDLGCGEGVFTNYLALKSPLRNLIGVELDKNRLAKADKGLRNTQFKSGDATKIHLPPADNIILFHLLHHLRSFSDQEKVIEACVEQLKKGGKLIIIEVDVKPTLRYITSWIVDCFIVPWIFEKRFYTPVHYRSKANWVKLLSSYDLKCLVKSYEAGKPFTHIAIECTKSRY